MEEPSPRGSRMALTGALMAVLVVGGGGFILGRATAERNQVRIAAPAAPATSVAQPKPVEPSVLDRAGLLSLAAAAADVTAGGEPRPEITNAEGRRFELRLAFGCDGPADAAARSDMARPAMRWRYDQASGSLRIQVAPVVWRAEDWWPSDSPADIESIQGFWIDRPWTSSEACPGEADDPTEAAPGASEPPARTLALGQIFGADASRAGRRDGQPYEAVIRTPEDELDTSKGFRLRISGRIALMKNSGSVHCREAKAAFRPPVCLVSVVLDEIAIENAAYQQTLATWDLRGVASAPG